MAKFLGRFLGKSTTTVQDEHSSIPFLDVGTVIDGRFRLDAEIGRGGMGVVYRAHDLQIDSDVAIKAIDPKELNSLTLGQFMREAKITSQLRHHHIVSVYKVGEMSAETDRSLPYIVMELLQGTPLSEMHGFTYGRIVDIGKQICEALTYIHEHGYLYRDLKPGNVILEKCGFHYCVKLIDFGLARPRDEAYLPNESTRAGTVFYLAPELIAGTVADAGADLYALGATLYEMITGRVPFSNIDEQNILAQHLQEKVPPPSASRSDVPPALEAIVLQLLEKDPADRFATAREVLRALEAVPFADATRARSNITHVEVAGREAEIRQVVSLLESSRIVTVLGDDGRLVQSVGSNVVPEFADGVWFVQLENVDNPALVLPTVSAVLGVTAKPNRPPVLSLIDALLDKNLLLILGSCGRVAPACAQLVDTILHACPEVYILTDSDRPLNPSSEICFDLSNRE